jgi:hypothetical protein
MNGDFSPLVLWDFFSFWNLPNWKHDRIGNDRTKFYLSIFDLNVVRMEGEMYSILTNALYGIFITAATL